MSGIAARRHVGTQPRRRRWVPLALTIVVLGVLLAVLAVMTDRGPAADGSSTAPASVDGGGADGARVDVPAAPAEEPNVVPEVRQHIDGLRPRGLDHRDPLRDRLDEATGRRP
jgi:hypothetical protein